MFGATENARHENTGRSKMQGWKMQDMKMRDQFARVENAGNVSMESQSVKKCLKVVVFVCTAKMAEPIDGKASNRLRYTLSVRLSSIVPFHIIYQVNLY